MNVVTANGTSSGAVNGTTESPLSTPSVGHKTSSVKSNSSASSGEVHTNIHVSNGVNIIFPKGLFTQVLFVVQFNAIFVALKLQPAVI